MKIKARPYGMGGFVAPSSMFFEGDDPKLDPNDPRVKALIEEATAGLKKNRDEILEEKRKLTEKVSEIETRFKPFDGLDPQKVKALLDRFDKDEEAKLIAEGKLDEVIMRRTEAMRKDAETKVTAAQEKISELEASAQKLTSRIGSLVIGSAIRSAAAKLELVPSAIDDAVEAGMKVFSLDEKEAPVARREDGSLIMGKDGKAPLDPAGWLEQRRADKPHWWAPSAGGGAGGSGGGGGNDRKVDTSKMSPRDKLMAGLSRSAA